MSWHDPKVKSWRNKYYAARLRAFQKSLPYSMHVLFALSEELRRLDRQRVTRLTPAKRKRITKLSAYVNRANYGA